MSLWDLSQLAFPAVPDVRISEKLKYQCDVLEAGLIDVPVSTMFMGSKSGNNSAVTSGAIVELAGLRFLVNKRDGWSFVICFQFVHLKIWLGYL